MLISELRRDYQGKPGWEKLVRDTHLGIAQLDAGRPLDDDLDPRAVALIEKYKAKD